MTCIFNVKNNRTILEANRNTYIDPILHPSRTMTCHVFFYVCEGEWSVGLEGETINAKKGSVVILPAKLMHYGIGKCSTGTRTLFFHAETESGDGYTDASTLKSTPNTLPVGSHTDTADNPNVKKFFENILMSRANGDDIRASAWFSLLICELYDTAHKKDNNSFLAYRIKNIIDNDLSADISNLSLANKIGKSTKHAENIFKETFGVTIHQYVISERLKKVKFYLENFPQMSIGNIADSLGFYDEFHLSRQFKKEYGVSPSQFRKSSLKKEFISCK